uniref:Uncharacterized protein n=1 Tax=Siphoviridae sp. ctX581 TaxID=2826365 RepID=A0A8S5MDD6_9CAUD|nr:MAG TPA: hypothetical protein [Siphoviridae sp. ctX581]
MSLSTHIINVFLQNKDYFISKYYDTIFISLLFLLSYSLS